MTKAIVFGVSAAIMAVIAISDLIRYKQRSMRGSSTSVLSLIITVAAAVVLSLLSVTSWSAFQRERGTVAIDDVSTLPIDEQGHVHVIEAGTPFTSEVTESPEEEQVEEDPSEEEIPEEPAVSNTELISAFMTETEDGLNGQFTDYEVADDGKNINISIWQEGLEDALAKVKAGDKKADELWQATAASLQTAAKSSYDRMNEMEVADRHLVVRLMGDKTQDLQVLMFVDGEEKINYFDDEAVLK